MVSVAMGLGGVGMISLAGQEAEKMSNITTQPALLKHLHRTWGLEVLTSL